MTDTVGWRLKTGVVTPSVNAVVQPEYDDGEISPLSEVDGVRFAPWRIFHAVC